MPGRELSLSQVREGLVQETYFLPRGGMLAHVGDAWFYSVDDGATWQELLGFEEWIRNGIAASVTHAK